MIDESDPHDAADGRADGRRRSGADLARELRESALDRAPLAVREGGRAVPWRAALAALLIAATGATALLSRAQAPGEEAVLPARTASAHPSGPAAAGDPASGGVPSPRGAPSPGGVASPGGVPSVGGAPGLASSGPPLVVDVAGRVRRPGLVRLPPGSRVWDAVTAAGGAGPGARLDRINLARPLTDGEQVLVPGAEDPLPLPPGPASGGSGGAGGAAGPGGAGAAAAAGSLVDLNSATPADLDALPGVGPVLAGRIVAWRTEHGRFSRVEELGEVTGIGDKLLAQLTPLVRV